MEDMREFVSYCRKLLRVLEKIEKLLESGKIGEALELVRELKEDTQKDIEAQGSRPGGAAHNLPVKIKKTGGEENDEEMGTL